jgi:hypothetical protein
MEPLKILVRVQWAVMQVTSGRRAISPRVPLALLSLILAGGICAAASWTPLKNLFPGPGVKLMVQETDGTILVGANGQSWYKLTPDITGNYTNGTWTQLASEPVARLYFASQVLPDGKFFVVGGEYSGPVLQANWSNTGEIYDPISNTWSAITPYPAQTGCPGISYVSGNVTIGSPHITDIYPDTTGLVVGWAVSGSGIPSGAAIVSIDSPKQITISANAASTQTATVSFPGHFFQLTGCLGDEPSILLPEGKILVGDLINRNTYVYNVATNSWAPSGMKVYTDQSDEEGWAKLGNGTVLNYDLFKSIATGGSYAEIYNPVTGTWSSISPSDGSAAGTIPQLSSGSVGDELGPVLRLQDGRIFVIGATQHTALYTPATNTWAAGPDIIGTPNGISTPFGADDAPGAVLPNGHVMFAADAGPSRGTFSPPTLLFDFDPTSNAISPLLEPAPDLLRFTSAYVTRMLVLPTGQVLFSNGSSQMWAYTPDGGPDPAKLPVINSVAYNGGGLFTLTGLHLNGQSAGAAYGDDAQMNSNYPIIRMIDATGNVFYARSSNWSSIVEGGTTPEAVNFTLNPGVTRGDYTLIVSGAGLSSLPATIHITGDEIAGH